MKANKIILGLLLSFLCLNLFAENADSIKIIKRNVEQYIGEINFDENGLGHLKLDGDKIKLDIEINKEDSLNAVDGNKVVVELTKKINNYKFKGKVCKILGHKHDPGVDILSVVYKLLFLYISASIKSLIQSFKVCGHTSTPNLLYTS